MTQPNTSLKHRQLLDEAFAAGKAVGILEERKMFCTDATMREQDYAPRIHAFYAKLDEIKNKLGKSK